MTRTSDRLATEEAFTGAVTRQAQDRVTEPDSPGGLRGRAAAVPPRAAAAPQTPRPEGSPAPLQGAASMSPQQRHGRVAAAGMPGPETGARPPLLGQAPVRARVQAPAGGAPSVPSASPAGSRGLRGAEWRKEAARASRRRPAKATPSATAKPAAKVTIPLVTGGAVLTATANCLGRCDWTAGPGDPAEVGKAAERHTTRPPKHPTNVVAEVAEIGGTA